MELTVIARAIAKPGSADFLLTEMRKVAELARGEFGNKLYLVHRGVENPSLFMTTERWSTREAYNAHLDTPHVEELFAKLPLMVAAPPEISILETVG